MVNYEIWDAPDIVPSITYADLPRAIEWLERVFGFRERAEARLKWPGGGMAWMEVGNGLFNITTPNETWRQDLGAGAPSVVMKVYIQDIDRHFARAKAEGATNHFRAAGRILGRPDLSRAGPRGESMGDFAAWPRSRRRALATASRRDTRSTQMTKPPNNACRRPLQAQLAVPSLLCSSAAALGSFSKLDARGKTLSDTTPEVLSL